ncbi:MAG: hypothetical protein IPN82_01285 [Chitinophagaceae bacterium]|nr:hypothetical protein [Chitinophagaceae bacterium]
MKQPHSKKTTFIFAKKAIQTEKKIGLNIRINILINENRMPKPEKASNLNETPKNTNQNPPPWVMEMYVTTSSGPCSSFGNILQIV